MHRPQARVPVTDIPRVVSVQVGLPRSVGHPDADDPFDRPWTSGIWKFAVAGPVRVIGHNLEGDAQADPTVHGGPDKAILVYAASHYPAWRAELGEAAMDGGAFGENLTVDGLDERTVRIGDIVSVGTALLQVSQPRGPCWKIARRWGIKDLTARVERTRRTGWYLRVLREGTLEAGLPMVLVERGGESFTIDRALRLVYGYRPADRDEAMAFARLPALAASWRASLEKRVARGH
jgi:MOSC domain-containing protein YiiM